MTPPSRDPKPPADSRCDQCGRVAPVHTCRQCGDEVCNECSGGAGTICFKCENSDGDDDDDDDTAC